jgi:hypothetical protein
MSPKIHSTLASLDRATRSIPSDASMPTIRMAWVLSLRRAIRCASVDTMVPVPQPSSSTEWIRSVRRPL